ncbi:MAG: hypothetical protein M3219_01475 [Thermoproteota archaeon]|nr:hypothetical protein [Thermoproteota archaeon]
MERVIVQVNSRFAEVCDLSKLVPSSEEKQTISRPDMNFRKSSGTA